MCDLITGHKTFHLLHYATAIKLSLHNTEITIKCSPLKNKAVNCYVYNILGDLGIQAILISTVQSCFTF